jgi:glyoxylase-like metal-dependent hydrolase (beta-lactamase superfamily II)
MKILSNFYRVTQVKENLWAIEDVVSTEHTVCYLVCGAKEALLFDVGLGVSPLLPLVKAITPLPVLVILSHWHFDHCGAASEFENILGWQSDAMQEISQNGFTNDSIVTLAGNDFCESIKPNKLDVQPFPQIKLTTTEQAIDIGDYNFQIIHTPGHTKDSICLYESRLGWLLTGDTVYPGPLYLQFEDSNTDAYSRSIRKLLYLEVSDVFPGHNKARVDADVLKEIVRILDRNDYASTKYPTLSIKI